MQDVDPFYPHNNPRSWISLLLPFHRGRRKPQKGKATYPSSAMISTKGVWLRFPCSENYIQSKEPLEKFSKEYKKHFWHIGKPISIG